MKMNERANQLRKNIETIKTMPDEYEVVFVHEEGDLVVCGVNYLIGDSQTRIEYLASTHWSEVAQLNQRREGRTLGEMVISWPSGGQIEAPAVMVAKAMALICTNVQEVIAELEARELK